jgi:hypothetical protein
MGNFRILIEAVGGHGEAREVPTGGVLPAPGLSTPEAKALAAVEALRAIGSSVTSAQFVHWPGAPEEVVDDLLTGRRVAGQFAEAPRPPEAP